MRPEAAVRSAPEGKVVGPVVVDGLDVLVAPVIPVRGPEAQHAGRASRDRDIADFDFLGCLAGDERDGAVDAKHLLDELRNQRGILGDAYTSVGILSQSG